MRRPIWFVLAVLFVLLAPGPIPAQDVPRPEIRVFFNPRLDTTVPTIEQVLVEAIAAAKLSVQVQAFYLTADNMGKVLAEAKQKNRALVVEVIVDGDNWDNAGTEVPRLREAGVAVWTDPAPVPAGQRRPHGDARNKVILIDGETTITGSPDLTATASSNAENIVVIKDRPTAAQYARNFDEHKKHSTRLLP